MDPGEIRGLPSRSLTLIVALDDPISFVSMPDRRMPPASFWSMIGGLHTAPAVVGHRGRQHGVQVDLTPIGACSVLGILPGEVGSAVVALADVAPRLASTLEQRLNDASSWDSCFDLLDDALLAMASERVALVPSVQAAWDLLAASNGTIAIETLARSVGSSSRHLSQQFRHALGISPKALARVMRFEGAQELLRSRPRQTIASVAATCGYADQAHMTRDWHAFSGSSPGRWRREERRFIQDGMSAVVQTQ